MKKSYIILLALALIFTACSKEGPMGPPGYDGYDGADGRDGKDGKDGIKGDNGTGSSPQLYYFDMPVTDFNRADYYNNTNEYYNDAWLAYGFIQDVVILETDLVMVFMHQTTDGGPDNYFQALPYSDYFDNSDIFNHYSYGTMDDNGDLIFSIRRSNGEAPFSDMNASFSIEYNIYIVKGTQNRKAEIPSHVNLEDEAALKEYLNITKREKVEFVTR